MSLRLDRLLTLYLFGPLPRLRKPKGLRIPILMYHSISDERETRHPYYWINTSPARFAEHMKYLHDNNYQVIPLSAAVDMIRSQSANPLIGSRSQSTSQPVNQSTVAPANQTVHQSASSPSCASSSPVNQSPVTSSPLASTRCVVLTFDDGYLDFYTRAFPVLKQYGFTATVFLPTAYIDGKRPGIRGKEHLNWDQVRELHSAGIDFGSHTVNHPQLHELSWTDIEYELKASKEAIEFELNQSTDQPIQGSQSTIPPVNRAGFSFDRQPETVNRKLLSIASFCYPYKFPEQDSAFVSKLTSLISEIRYNCKVNTRIGSQHGASDALCLKRLPINSADDISLFSAKLAAQYDWMSWPQRLTKLCKRPTRSRLQPHGQPLNTAGLDRQPASSSAKNVRYVVITPVRDEEKYLQFTLDSVINQTVLPIEWIIVNDGSIDRTGTIVDHAVSNYPWIKAVHRENRGFRKAGGGVIDAFYEGYKSIHHNDWQFLIKLDGDLSFQTDYFEHCFEAFLKNPRLGVGGGDIHNLVDGRLELEKQPRFHVRGATKVYKRDCWEAIGGLLSAPGWDTLDEVKANMLGWTTESFSNLKVTHHRVTGSADGSWRDAVKNGLSDYICAYHPLFMMIKCAKRSLVHPKSSVGHLFGFAQGYVKRVRRVEDRQLIQYLRNQQLRRLTLRSTIWQ